MLWLLLSLLLYRIISYFPVSLFAWIRRVLWLLSNLSTITMEFYKESRGKMSVNTLFAFGIVFFFLCVWGFILPITSNALSYFIVDNMKLILYDVFDFLFLRFYVRNNHKVLVSRPGISFQSPKNHSIVSISMLRCLDADEWRKKSAVKWKEHKRQNIAT